LEGNRRGFHGGDKSNQRHPGAQEKKMKHLRLKIARPVVVVRKGTAAPLPLAMVRPEPVKKAKRRPLIPMEAWAEISAFIRGLLPMAPYRVNVRNTLAPMAKEVGISGKRLQRVLQHSEATRRLIEAERVHRSAENARRPFEMPRKLPGATQGLSGEEISTQVAFYPRTRTRFKGLQAAPGQLDVLRERLA
jgi:hypothetical protein